MLKDAMPDDAHRLYHHGDLRRALIDTAMDMLAQDRNWQFTLREVARRAGVSHAAPYKHFPDKSALLAELSLIGFDRLREALVSARTRAGASVRDTIIAMAESYMDFATRNPALYRLMFSTEAGGASVIHVHERALAPLAALIAVPERGQTEGVLRKRDVRNQAAACWAQVHGLALLSLDGLLVPENAGRQPVENALLVLLEGLEKITSTPGPAQAKA
jgi:AcrR family transcriptional regulator